MKKEFIRTIQLHTKEMIEARRMHGQLRRDLDLRFVEFAGENKGVTLPERTAAYSALSDVINLRAVLSKLGQAFNVKITPQQEDEVYALVYQSGFKP